MSPTLFDRYLRALNETLTMVSLSSAIAIICGLTLAVVLVVTAPGGLYPRPVFNKMLSLVVNMFRSVPFIILLVALIPVTRFIVGTTLGVWAALVPLSIHLIPFYARIVQVSLLEVDKGLIEAAHAMGLKRHHIVWHVLLRESLPAIIGGMTVCVVVMIGSSAMAGAVGAGGLGDLAIRYGYERYETRVLFEIIAMLIVMVSIVQFAGEKLARRVDHR